MQFVWNGSTMQMGVIFNVAFTQISCNYYAGIIRGFQYISLLASMQVLWFRGFQHVSVTGSMLNSLDEAFQRSPFRLWQSMWKCVCVENVILLRAMQWYDI
ncbi:hypothetical protein CEXT_22561 [Caerostris extrusa]|uniref:Uncharacterized protein n=1 Tax=Caerostris extrusa TaxID=172846 RepID=A0AAV4N010_CAEEX|nr:hypothetical protein CEXT_22561 [Caerostris extrusa]